MGLLRVGTAVLLVAAVSHGLPRPEPISTAPTAPQVATGSSADPVVNQIVENMSRGTATKAQLLNVLAQVYPPASEALEADPDDGSRKKKLKALTVAYNKSKGMLQGSADQGVTAESAGVVEQFLNTAYSLQDGLPSPALTDEAVGKFTRALQSLPSSQPAVNSPSPTSELPSAGIPIVNNNNNTVTNTDQQQTETEASSTTSSAPNPASKRAPGNTHVNDLLSRLKAQPSVSSLTSTVVGFMKTLNTAAQQFATTAAPHLRKSNDDLQVLVAKLNQLHQKYSAALNSNSKHSPEYHVVNVASLYAEYVQRELGGWNLVFIDPHSLEALKQAPAAVKSESLKVQDATKPNELQVGTGVWDEPDTLSVDKNSSVPPGSKAINHFINGLNSAKNQASRDGLKSAQVIYKLTLKMIDVQDKNAQDFIKAYDSTQTPAQTQVLATKIREIRNGFNYTAKNTGDNRQLTTHSIDMFVQYNTRLSEVMGSMTQGKKFITDAMLASLNQAVAAFKTGLQTKAPNTSAQANENKASGSTEGNVLQPETNPQQALRHGKSLGDVNVYKFIRLITNPAANHTQLTREWIGKQATRAKDSLKAASKYLENELKPADPNGRNVTAMKNQVNKITTAQREIDQLRARFTGDLAVRMRKITSQAVSGLSVFGEFCAMINETFIAYALNAFVSPAAMKRLQVAAAQMSTAQRQQLNRIGGEKDFQPKGKQPPNSQQTSAIVPSSKRLLPPAVQDKHRAETPAVKKNAGPFSFLTNRGQQNTAKTTSNNQRGLGSFVPKFQIPRMSGGLNRFKSMFANMPNFGLKRQKGLKL